MLLEELLFCAIFMGLPLIGMLGMLIKRVLKGEIALRKDSSKKAIKRLDDMECALQRKRALQNELKQAPFANIKEKDFVHRQLLKHLRVHIPLPFCRFNKRAHPRAGP